MNRWPAILNSYIVLTCSGGWVFNVQSKNEEAGSSGRASSSSGDESSRYLMALASPLLLWLPKGIL